MAARKADLLRTLTPTVVTPSHWLAGQVKQSLIGTACPVEVIPNGIDRSVFTPTDSDFRRRYGLENKSVLLAVAYAWNRQKGLDVLCNLAARLGEDCRLVMVGTDPAVERQLPPSVLPIRRTDSPQALAAIYTAADVLVNPTREETYPTVNMEAIACGTPVVTFDTGGCRETVPPACGAVVPKDDGEALYREAMAACTAGRYTAWNCVAAAAAFDRDACFCRYLDLWGVPQPRRNMQESTE
jgi:glycosyltransferase involved in cell wall biosynthesis